MSDWTMDRNILESVTPSSDEAFHVAFSDGCNGLISLKRLKMDLAEYNPRVVRLHHGKSAVEVKERRTGDFHSICGDVLRAMVDTEYADELRREIAALES